jgi:hypothetical protein
MREEAAKETRQEKHNALQTIEETHQDGFFVDDADLGDSPIGQHVF